MMLERQKEGVAKVKAAGKYKGRKAVGEAIRQEVVRLALAKLPYTEFCRTKKLSRLANRRLAPPIILLITILSIIKDALVLPQFNAPIEASKGYNIGGIGRSGHCLVYVVRDI